MSTTSTQKKKGLEELNSAELDLAKAVVELQHAIATDDIDDVAAVADPLRSALALLRVARSYLEEDANDADAEVQS